MRAWYSRKHINKQSQINMEWSPRIVRSYVNFGAFILKKVKKNLI